MTSPTDFEILKAIRDYYYNAFISFDQNVPNRLSKIYVPIDVELVAEKLGVDGDIVFERLYYYLDKKYSYKNEDGNVVKFFANSLHAGTNKEKHLINFPLLDVIVSDNNADKLMPEGAVDVDPDWHERILLALFEKKNTVEFYNLFLLAKNESEKDTIRIKSSELQSKKLIDFESHQSHNSFFKSKNKVMGSSEKTHEQKQEKYHNELNAKINLDGLEYVKVNVLKRQLNSPQQFLSHSSSTGSSKSFRRRKNRTGTRIRKIMIAVIAGLIIAFLAFSFGWI
jgi:hypothetical protein